MVVIPFHLAIQCNAFRLTHQIAKKKVSRITQLQRLIVFFVIIITLQMYFVYRYGKTQRNLKQV